VGFFALRFVLAVDIADVLVWITEFADFADTFNVLPVKLHLTC
jgi:hypothetical protein